jgi:hypothetical protein
MFKLSIGNNCGLLYQDNNGNLMLISATPVVFQSGEILEVFYEEQWTRGRLEHSDEGGWALCVNQNVCFSLKNGMKARAPKDAKL